MLAVIRLYNIYGFEMVYQSESESGEISVFKDEKNAVGVAPHFSHTTVAWRAQHLRGRSEREPAYVAAHSLTDL